MVRWLVFAVLSVLVAAPCHAEKKFRMASGEYVVGLKNSPKGRASALGPGRKLLKNLGRDASLISTSALSAPSALASRVEADVTDADLDFCKQGIRRGLFSHCSPNYIYTVSTLPNDPRYSSLWGMENIAAPDAWGISTGTNEVVVAVIDTGIDYSHPDLAANVWANPGEVAGNGIDDDGNGYVDDVHGMNAINGSGDPYDDNSHGTHVAGTIGGVGNNGVGVAGVNWNVRIMGLKFLSGSGSGSLSDAIEAINYMVAMKNRGINVRVSNNSWGGGGYSQALANAIQAANQAGIVFVAAAGNESTDTDASPSYPAGYDVSNVVSVAAIGQQNELASFSNYGATTVDIGAPGVGILSTVPGGLYSSYSGTSMATPHVSGALALLLSVEPELSVSQLIDRLYLSGVERSSLAGVVRTGRSLNVARMLTNSTAPVPTPPPTPTPCGYEASELSFTPNRLGESGSQLLSGDDVFTTLTLPREFLFGGSPVTRVKLSTNGPIYFGSTFPSTDYSVGSLPYKNSVAALWADQMGDSPLGIKAIFTDDRLVMYHEALIWNFPTLEGETFHIKTWVEWTVAGIIRVWYEFSRPEVEAYVQAWGLLGIRETEADTAVVVPSTSVRSQSGYQFSPRCGSSTEPTPSPTPTPEPSVTPPPDPTPTAPPDVPDPTPVPEPTATPTPPADLPPDETPAPVSVSFVISFNPSVIASGGLVRTNRSLRVMAVGEGTGTTQATFALNGRRCPGNIALPIAEGLGQMSRFLPRELSSARRLAVSIGGAEARYRVVARRDVLPRLDSSRFNQLCRALTAGTLSVPRRTIRRPQG